MLLSPSIGFHAFFSEFGPSLSYLILSYLIFPIFCLPAGFWCWDICDDFKYPRGYPYVQQRSNGQSLVHQSLFTTFSTRGFVTSSVRHSPQTLLPIHSTTTHINSSGHLLDQIQWSEYMESCILLRCDLMKMQRSSPSPWIQLKLTRRHLKLLQPSCLPRMQHSLVCSLCQKLGQSMSTLVTN